MHVITLGGAPFSGSTEGWVGLTRSYAAVCVWGWGRMARQQQQQQQQQTKHLRAEDLDTSIFASKWFTTLFIYSLPLRFVRRILCGPVGVRGFACVGLLRWPLRGAAIFSCWRARL
jgi:hypothetical protein